MKINEIINEAKKFRRAFHDASPDTETYQQLDNNNSPYLAYRFGIALAGAPDETMDRHGPVGGQFTTVGYSDADREILDAAKKLMGVKGKKQTSKGSKELPTTNTTSPTRQRNKK